LVFEKERGPIEAYEASSTVVRPSHGRIEDFPNKVDLHHGSGLSPFLFILMLDVISEQFRCGLPCELLFADDQWQW